MRDSWKQNVLDANLALVKHGLVVLNWGNASAVDRHNGRVIIKPSGMEYSGLQLSDMVVVDFSGEVLEGDLNPSADLQTHLALYNAWPALGSVVHTHSACATAFAQAARPIPCLGTTHADHFYGPVPVTRGMTRPEVESDYELNTGRVILECFRDQGLDPETMPAVLVRNHGPFVWGRDLREAVENSVALEHSASMALACLCLDPDASALEEHLLARHYSRKHGPGAYYGQGPKR